MNVLVKEPQVQVQVQPLPQLQLQPLPLPLPLPLPQGISHLRDCRDGSQNPFKLFLWGAAGHKEAEEEEEED